MMVEPDETRLDTIVRERFERSCAVPESFFTREVDQLAHACWSMARRFYQGGRLIAFGNGACATDAQHVAVEFVHPVIMGKRALPALALTNDSAFLSSQNSGDGPAFDRQVSLLARSQDIAMAFSLDGDEANLLNALVLARQKGLLTIGLAGAEGGAMANMKLDFCFIVPDQDPMLIQETHEVIYHVLWELVHVFLEHEGLLV
jgi:D-sedoheptulose 7-phosphate isomerase